MKFKDKTDEFDGSSYRELIAIDRDGDTIKVEVENKRAYIVCSTFDGVYLTRAKALKLAWAIIGEFDR